MTTITFQSEEDRIIGFRSVGHSGYAEEGSDIVCAAITSAIRLVETTMNDVLGLCAAVKVSEENTEILFRLPGGLSFEAESACQAYLTGLMVYFTELREEFPAHIEVLEEEFSNP